MGSCPWRIAQVTRFNIITFSILYQRKNAKAGVTESGRLEGPILTVCVDCKEMILQVIRAQSTARRLRMAKSLFNGGSELSQNKESFINSDVWGEEFY